MKHNCTVHINYSIRTHRTMVLCLALSSVCGIVLLTRHVSHHHLPWPTYTHICNYAYIQEKCPRVNNFFVDRVYEGGWPVFSLAISLTHERGAPNRLLVKFVYSNLMLNSISLAARNVRILLTCLWIHLPGTKPANLCYVCCPLLKKNQHFGPHVVDLMKDFVLLEWTPHNSTCCFVSAVGGEPWISSKLPTVETAYCHL